MAPRCSAGPVRTCIGCRRRDLAPSLVRVVVRSESDSARTVLVDVDRRLPGRGAWLHPHSDCVSAAVRRRAFGPALRDHGLTVAPDDLDDLIDEIITPDDSAGNQDR